MRDFLDRWRRERARKASARWMVRMHGPDAFRWREAFERWHAASSLNGQTYDRQRLIWNAAPQLGTTQPVPARPKPVIGYALAASIAVLALGLTGLGAWNWRRAPIAFVADQGRSRAITLADGSRALLARGSRLEVSFDQDHRRMALKQGRMRLELLRDQRPGVVRAGPVEVRTAGATVDLSVGRDEARVILLAGRVQLARYDADDERSLADLQPGELLEIGRAPEPSEPRQATATDLAWPDMMISFNDAPLAEVVARANALGFARIELAEPSLGALRVTGAYRMGDNERFARSLAESLKLTVTRPADGVLRLRKPGRLDD